MRRSAKVDANQSAIVDALRAIGCSVLSMAPLGQGCPDILVGRLGRNYILEVKDGNKVPSKRRLTPDELTFHGSWLGQIAVVDSVESAIEAVTA